MLIGFIMLLLNFFNQKINVFMFATPITLAYGQLNNQNIIKFNFIKCPSDGDKKVEYFTYLLMRILNIKYKNLYKQTPSTSIPFYIN